MWDFEIWSLSHLKIKHKIITHTWQIREISIDPCFTQFKIMHISVFISNASVMKAPIMANASYFQLNF